MEKTKSYKIIIDIKPDNLDAKTTATEIVTREWQSITADEFIETGVNVNATFTTDTSVECAILTFNRNPKNCYDPVTYDRSVSKIVKNIKQKLGLHIMCFEFTDGVHLIYLR